MDTKSRRATLHTGISNEHKREVGKFGRKEKKIEKKRGREIGQKRTKKSKTGHLR